MSPVPFPTMYDFSSPLQHLLDRERVSADPVFERLALKQFHGDEVLAVRLVNFVNRADVWMIQRGRGEGLPLKPFAGGRILFHFSRQELQCEMVLPIMPIHGWGDDVMGRSIKV